MVQMEPSTQGSFQDSWMLYCTSEWQYYHHKVCTVNFPNLRNKSPLVRQIRNTVKRMSQSRSLQNNWSCGRWTFSLFLTFWPFHILALWNTLRDPLSSTATRFFWYWRRNMWLLRLLTARQLTWQSLLDLQELGTTFATANEETAHLPEHTKTMSPTKCRILKYPSVAVRSKFKSCFLH